MRQRAMCMVATHDLRTMKKWITLITLASSLLASTNLRAQTGRLEPKAFKAEVDKGTAQLIDVRTAEEFAKGHLAGAVNIDWLADSFTEASAKLDKKKPALLYCAGGGRSEEAKAAMEKAGFAHVQDMLGGIIAWKKEGLPVSAK